VNFRSSVGSGSYILQPDQENACDNLISGACPLSTNSVATHRLNLFIPDTLFPGFDVTLEIFLRNAQGGIVNCYEADFRIF
jgi:ML domain